MTTETVQFQIDFVETKLKDLLILIDILKRTYCVEELPQALTDDKDLQLLINGNIDVSHNHENALVGIENFDLKDLHKTSAKGMLPPTELF